MTSARSQFSVDQAGFGFSQEKNALRMRDNSFASDAEARMWETRLIDHVRIVPIGTADVPDTAWSYFRFDDGTAALLHRLRAGHSSGRNDSQALIGSADALTASVALGFAWKHRSSGGELSASCHAHLLVEAESYGIHRGYLRDKAQEWWDAFVTVLARVLEKPGDPLSVIGCPDEFRLMMIATLRAIVEDQRLDRRGILPFGSFSTYEHSHDTSVVGLPDLVFLSKRPSGLGTVERVVVDLVRDDGEGVYADEARLILDRFIKTQPPPEQVMAVRESDKPVPWKRIESTGPEPRPSAQPARRRQEPSAGKTAGLLRARSLAEFGAELDRLSAPCQLQHIRQEVRNELDVRTVDTLTALVENDLVRDLESRLLEIMYGKSFSDLEDAVALKHAKAYIAQGRSGRFSRLLARDVEKRNPMDALGAVFDRWVNEDPNRAQTPSRLAQRAKRVRHLPLILAVAAIAVLTAVFLLGVLVGGSPAAPQAAAPPVPSPPAGLVVAVPPVTRSVAGTVPAGYQVFAFLKADELYYPQSVCEKPRADAWSCRWQPSTALQTAVPVAIPVPVGRVAGLAEQAAARGGIPHEAGWGLELGDA